MADASLAVNGRTELDATNCPGAAVIDAVVTGVSVTLSLVTAN